MEPKVVEIDVRADLKKKIEPFQKIMDAIADLREKDSLILHAPFQPVPLYAVMKAKKFTHLTEKMGEKHWKITFVRQGE